MQVQELKEMVERQPFRPFKIRLVNGAQYEFKSPRDVGAPKDYHMLIYFGETEAIRIDAESVAETMEK